MTNNKMDQPAAHAPSGPDVVSEQVDAPAHERARRLGAGWEFEPRHVAWACPNRDRQSALGNLLNLVRGWLSR